jgi:response regulator RpfG family c-di-GMP phosphodiesterase
MKWTRFKTSAEPKQSLAWKPAVAVRPKEPRKRVGASEGAPCPTPSNGGSPDDTEGILFALARAVEQRDQVTLHHCERLALISVALGVAMKLDQTRLTTLYRGGYLHDIGKVGIPDSILIKEGPLTPSEWAIMQSHSTLGEEICGHMKSLGPVLPIIRHHHERWDGTGYPDGLKGERIPFLARVVHIADVYDALTNRRCYKNALSDEDAMQVIRVETRNGWHDPELAAMFAGLHGEVMSKIARYSASTEARMEHERSSLLFLNEFLAWQA